MKNCTVLLLLLIVATSFISCSKNSETLDYRLPIRSELPLSGYLLNSIDSINKEAVYDLLDSNMFAIQSQTELDAYLNKIECLYDKKFRKKYPEYTSVDFSKQTLLSLNYIMLYYPKELIAVNSYFYTGEYATKNPYLSEEYEKYDYYYVQNHRFYSTESDETPVFVYVSGIVVDKIPANMKVRSIVSHSATASNKILDN